jgi:hypothetical protein
LQCATFQGRTIQYNTIQYNNTSHIITHDPQSNTQKILYEQI